MGETFKTLGFVQTLMLTHALILTLMLTLMLILMLWILMLMLMLGSSEEREWAGF